MPSLDSPARCAQPKSQISQEPYGEPAVLLHAVQQLR